MLVVGREIEFMGSYLPTLLLVLADWPLVHYSPAVAIADSLAYPVCWESTTREIMLII